VSSQAVVKVKIDLEFLPGLHKRIIRFQIYFLVLDAFPEALHENIVHPPAFFIHADADSSANDSFGKLIAGLDKKDLLSYGSNTCL
jgi:hypothetical protein